MLRLLLTESWYTTRLPLSQTVCHVWNVLRVPEGKFARSAQDSRGRKAYTIGISKLQIEESNEVNELRTLRAVLLLVQVHLIQ